MTRNVVCAVCGTPHPRPTWEEGEHCERPNCPGLLTYSQHPPSSAEAVHCWTYTRGMLPSLLDDVRRSLAELERLPDALLPVPRIRQLLVFALSNLQTLADEHRLDPKEPRR